MISAKEAKIKTSNRSIYKIFMDRINAYIEGAINLGRYDCNVASRILGENDDLINVPLEVMELAKTELEKLGYKARIYTNKEALEISWED